DNRKSFLGDFNLRQQAFDHRFTCRQEQIYFDDSVGYGIARPGKSGDAFLPESFVTFKVSQFDERRAELQIIERDLIPTVEAIEFDQRCESLRSLTPATVYRVPIAQCTKDGRAFDRRFRQWNFGEQLVGFF